MQGPGATRVAVPPPDDARASCNWAWTSSLAEGTTAKGQHLPLRGAWSTGSSAPKAVSRRLAIERPPELVVAKHTQQRDLGLRITGNPGDLGEVGR